MLRWIVMVAGALLSLACSPDSFVADAGADACTDPTFCNDKCGTGLANACGVSTDCRTDCGQGATCNGVTHQCECAQDSQWCSNRCGATVDNCNNPINCGGCETGSCNANICGSCVPDKPKTTCGTQNITCGPALNNCNQVVDCGLCTPSQNCESGHCCDDTAVTCIGKCGAVTNNCGTVVQCGQCTNTNARCCSNQCVVPGCG